jgi:hypothetical protein
VLQLDFCNYIQCHESCKNAKCAGFEPLYFGIQWADITCHICWAIGSFFWFRVILGFLAVHIFELLRRAKLTEVSRNTVGFLKRVEDVFAFHHLGLYIFFNSIFSMDKIVSYLYLALFSNFMTGMG